MAKTKGSPVVVASRIFLPEAAAASFRLGAVVRALANISQVDVLTSSYKGCKATKAGSSVPEASGRVRVSRWPVLRDAGGYVRGYLPYLSFDLPLFFRLLFHRRPSVILVEPPPTTGVIVRLASWLRRTPYVWYAADIWSDASEIAGAPKVVVAAVRLMEKFAVRGACGIIAVSEGVADRIRELGGRNIRVIPNGIDTSVYRPDVDPLERDELAALGIVGPYILYAGTASEWQGATVFAEAMKEVATENQELQLVFVGQGSEWPELERFAAQLEADLGRKALVLLAPREPELIARLLVGANAAAVSIVPGRGYDFAYPTKAIAALAAGTPVLFAGAGPLAEEIEREQLGWAVGHDPKAVADAILQASVREEVTDGPRLRQHVEGRRSLTTTGKRAAQFLQSVMRGGGQPRISE